MFQDILNFETVYLVQACMHTKAGVQYSTIKTTTLGRRIYISFFSHFVCQKFTLTACGKKVGKAEHPVRPRAQMARGS